MASRALRSRTVEISPEDLEMQAGENTSDRPSEQPEDLGSLGEPSEQTYISPHEVALGPQPDVSIVGPEVEAGTPSPELLGTGHSIELKQILAGIMAAIQQSNATLQESVRAELNTLREQNQVFQENIRADIHSVRTDLRSENEKLIKRFESQTQEAKKEFAAKLDLETRRLTNLVGKVQQETESELAAVKRQMQTLSTDFEDRLEQSQTNAGSNQ